MSLYLSLSLLLARSQEQVPSRTYSAPSLSLSLLYECKVCLAVEVILRVCAASQRVCARLLGTLQSRTVSCLRLWEVGTVTQIR